ncbi:hypothetical protein SNEBB_003258 [Seison nebaliae]|nr:hypothetical protein SNEBB_003258 [Seison nebaliae]
MYPCVEANGSDDCYQWGKWRIRSSKGVMANEDEIEEIKKSVQVDTLPEMLFNKNSLHLTYEKDEYNRFVLSFNVIDALKSLKGKLVKTNVAVHGSDKWRNSRAQYFLQQNIDENENDDDWTFASDYTGSLEEDENFSFEETDERIDYENLRIREKIHYEESLILYEDELGDQGISECDVRIRCMPTGFLILLRVFLRVDNVYIRSLETRYRYRTNNNILMKEVTERENFVDELNESDADTNMTKNVDRIIPRLKLIKLQTFKIKL